MEKASCDLLPQGLFYFGRIDTVVLYSSAEVSLMSIVLLRRERFWRTLHFYLGLLLSLQLLAWFSSGVVMSWLQIAEVRGEHLQTATPQVRWRDATLGPAKALQLAPAEFVQAKLSLSQRGDSPVYQLQQGEKQLFISAITGETLTPLSVDEIQQFAQLRYQGMGKVHSAVLLSELSDLPGEARGLAPPVWQVHFADDEQSTFYLHPITGQVQRVRTERWRLFDFFWMLHIMDYENRSDFNHPLLIISAGSALAFTVGGLVLIAFRMRKGARRHNVSTD